MIRRAAFLAMFVIAFCSITAGGASGRDEADSCRLFSPRPCLTSANADARSAAQRFAAATTDGSILRGLGLPSLSGVDGAAAGKDKRILNEDVVSLFTKPFPASRKTSGLESGSQTEPSSKTFSNSVDGVGAVLGLKQRVGSGGVRWVRDAKVYVIVGKCPEMKNAQNTHGHIELSLKGSYGVVGFWNQGGVEIERGVLVTIEPLLSNGSVDQNARFFNWNNWRGLDVVVTRTTRERRPGKKTKYQRVSGTWTATPAANGWKIEGDPFDNFMKREDEQNGDEPPPPGRESPLINEEAWKRVVRAFVELAESALQRSVAEAERGWRTPNTCATIDWQPNSGRLQMSAGDTRQIEGRIVPRAGGIEGLSNWPGAPREFVGKVRQVPAPGSAPGRPTRIVAAAERPVRNQSVRIRWRVPSTIGVAEAEWTANAGGLPERWEGTFTGTGAGEPVIEFQGTVSFVKDERFSSDVSYVYAVTKAKFTATARWTICGEGKQPWSDDVSLGRQKTGLGNKLEIYLRPTPGKGHVYYVGVNLEGPTYKVENPCRTVADPRDTTDYTPVAGFGSSAIGKDVHTNGTTIKGSSWLGRNKFGETWELHAAG